jgi:hypothetical protein
MISRRCGWVCFSADSEQDTTTVKTPRFPRGLIAGQPRGTVSALGYPPPPVRGGKALPTVSNKYSTYCTALEEITLAPGNRDRDPSGDQARLPLSSQSRHTCRIPRCVGQA